MSGYTGYIKLIIAQALAADPGALIYDWFPFPDTIETVIEWSNGVVSQNWTLSRKVK